MAEVRLPFGKERITVTIPDERFQGTLVSDASSYKAEKG